MIKSVFVVASGEYSDYRVDGIFDTRELAEEFIREFPETDCGGVEEWPINPGIDEVRQGRNPYRVLMLRDGTTESVHIIERSRYALRDIPYIWRRSTAPAYRGKGIPDCLSGTFWGTDQQHAVKIANEKRTRMIAEGLWPEDDEPEGK